MTLIREIATAFLGLSFGFMVACGVFTVMYAIGLVPRFVTKTQTARFVVLYEEFIIAGTVMGCLCSVFSFPYRLGEFIKKLPVSVSQIVSTGMLIMIGIFVGMFIGCLALALAEMIDSIPIFTRRMGFRHGLGIVVLAMAFGKVCGALIYFCMHYYMIYVG